MASPEQQPRFAPPYEGINPEDEALVAQSDLFELRSAAILAKILEERVTADDLDRLAAAEQRARDLVLDANSALASVKRIDISSYDAVTQDLVKQIERGEITESEADEVLFRLGLFHRTEGDAGF